MTTWKTRVSAFILEKLKQNFGPFSKTQYLRLFVQEKAFNVKNLKLRKASRIPKKHYNKRNVGCPCLD